MTVIKFNPKINRNMILNKYKRSSIIPSNNSTRPKVIKMQNIILPNEVQDMIKDFFAAKSPLELMKSLRDRIKQVKGFEKISLTSYKFGDFKIDSLLTSVADNILENTKIVKTLDLKTAPELVKHVKNNFGESLLISKIDGLKNANLINASELESLSNNAKKIIKEDMEKLKNNGFILPDIRFKNNILVDKNTGDAMLINFASLRKPNNANEINDFLIALNKL